ncbi:MAG: hypothetical protein A2268_06060 [Candidatus Raymondbacteria bacterium RifOxyA12_full_50_37]|uniref:Rubrerythrin diiron-binding domain-containing protein n=1 Tax=Candidatus Raymondbacteria bacterium RIFOXYD12_FULL_49_13 TaxID=1817890 RepID=A0A1F7FJX1_UNCRA|nr:MAG: hypothetical protein A2268_06060 [Candidatus Raymondbacteria bacterium RifOxyA12_full_50_37]OGJ94532.1 MAG: hypothetical protein A2248_14990 [Candidatus Raymondbacteria bacterium RIFOXYA2_FULL_49_16]OGJ98517.1 MAG: hypothetical protein A2487_05475 [Candidatus Raymondbacteria bacterium RifOxyC12_full_50_8]OGK07009.1 MAG: hypothetical protein A2519_13630 [Candidatus Raymondbacteria bacterium RIFOXYD12_FULL_49_13]OGP45481.1 MAG: hypothetical protein A2324_15070 [Candidatus Raymondbacteria 
MFNADELFAMGIEIEKNGAAFYQAAAVAAGPGAAQRLFTELYEWELDHVALFEKLHDKAVAGKKYSKVEDTDGLGRAYLTAMAANHVFTGASNPATMAKKCKGPRQVIEIAMQFEKDSVALYAGMKGLVPRELGRKHIDTLIHEEVKHIGMLQKKL